MRALLGYVLGMGVNDLSERLSIFEPTSVSKPHMFRGAGHRIKPSRYDGASIRDANARNGCGSRQARERVRR
jgi:hypothetical protein